MPVAARFLNNLRSARSRYRMGVWVPDIDEGRSGSRYCGSCGAEVHGTRFCESCGRQTSIEGTPRNLPAADVSTEVPASPTWSKTPPLGTPVVRRTWKGRTGVVAATVALVIAIGLVVGFLIVRSSPTSYAQEVAGPLRSLVLRNGSLAKSIDSLANTGSNSQAARQAIQAAQVEIQIVQQEVTTEPNQQAAVESSIEAALSAESQWLSDAAAVLANPASPLSSQLSALGIEAQSRLKALEQYVLVMQNSVFPNSSQIVSYALAAATRDQTNSQNLAFSNEVMSLLNESEPYYQQINSLYEQLQSAADGEPATITLSQAEQQIETIISNRTSLMSSAQVLTAQSSAAQSVRTLLVDAFNAALQDDNDVANCLNQSNDGYVAYIYQSCLSDSQPANNAATAAKEAFLAAYNQLRATLGQPAVQPDF